VSDWYRLCAISDFWRGVNEIFTLLGCYAARLVISYQRYGPFFNGQAWPLKMRPIGYPETSVTKYPAMLRNNSEQRLSKMGIFLQFRKMTLRCADFFTIGLPCNNQQELYITLNTVLWVAVMHTSSPPPPPHTHTHLVWKICDLANFWPGTRKNNVRLLWYDSLAAVWLAWKY